MGNLTTIDTLTDAQIESLLAEASAAGDDAQVVLCKAALSGGMNARRACLRAIQSAERNADEFSA